MTARNALSFGWTADSTALVRNAIERRDPLPGVAGFAGSIDGRLVRDVLGRVPLYVERELIETDESNTAIEFDDWSHSPTTLVDPVTYPPGCVGDPSNPTSVWDLPAPEPASDHASICSNIDATIRRILGDVETDRTAVAFSGGVDSALLASMLDVPLYTVGFPDGHDLEAARSAAAAMSRTDDLRVRELTIDEVERAIPRVAHATGRTNAMDVAIGTSVYLVAEAAARDGIDRLVFGQGADELFGGYEKIARLDHRVEANSVRGAVTEQLKTVSDQLPRDILAVEAAGVTPVFPYLHDDLIADALRLGPEHLVSASARKITLRQVASVHLPDSISTREKKALQYGSLVSRELDRLARRAGYKRRMDDHVRLYVESRLEERESTKRTDYPGG
ncbi:asparagine synthase C-terminal domain-containing protein [Halovivax gelatinilyticus]|uniref:asparagine synthase C-terminal domain-containing protein n=1 Tax=Halovivax gelatinilyticus TaxID=2961597 RepID=UPI0020CA6761|nr:asparagine synthase-related protein [Halovivax gelatinilyticus]